MKHIRMFESAEQAAAILPTLEYNTLSAIRGESGIALKPGAPPPGPETIPFYIEDVSGSENTVQITKGHNNAPTLTIEKSTDGETWESMGTTSTTAIIATIPANGKLYLRCNTTKWGEYNWGPTDYYNSINTIGNCNVGGNIMSLLYGSNFTGEESTFPSGSNTTFYRLFNDNAHLVDASNLLIPTTLANYCYMEMFYNCASLTTSPALPATTLAEGCYKGMFRGCTSLTAAPALPAMTLAKNCYSGMFRGCTSLTTAPALPATTMVDYCYEWMFGYCTSLTTAPALPATTLARSCYESMFYSCTSLTTAPELPATTLVRYCYTQMFYQCRNLNYIKCLATDISASSCTDSWVQSVSSTGTFVKDPNMSSWATSTSGIPSGWTTQDA